MTAPTASSTRVQNLWPRQLPVVMAILNCTPDSFSDGGLWHDPAAAIAQADTLIEQGADIIDIGGESTRPGAKAVDAATEVERVLPVINAIRQRHPDVILSIDTTKPEVANIALTAGADIINDVNAGRANGMFECAAAFDAPIILMHMRGSPRSMQTDTRYDDVAAEVHEFLGRRAAAAIAAGISRDRVWLDPGIGFGKDDDGNVKLIAAIPDLAALGFPVVLGASRKSFIGRITDAPVDQRLGGSLAALIAVLGLERTIVRVHEVQPTRQFLHIAHLLSGIAS